MTGSGADDQMPRVYLDEHGFILSGQDPPPPPQTQKQADKEAKKLDRWMSLIEKWETTRQDYPKLKKYTRQGIPAALRGLAWQLILGSRKLEMEHPGLYEELLKREMDPELRDIAKRDLSRTFPSHALFSSSEGIGQQSLFKVLHAYAVHDPRIGYCQGMGFIVATLLTQMGEEQAFWAFVVLMKDSKYLMGDMYLPGFPKVQLQFEVLRLLLVRFGPRLAEHFDKEGINISFFASQWFMTLFVYLFPFKLLLQVWDIFLVERWKIIFRIALQLLLSEEDQLCELGMDEILPRLKTLYKDKDPENLIADACKLKITNREIDLLIQSVQRQTKNTE